MEKAVKEIVTDYVRATVVPKFKCLSEQIKTRLDQPSVDETGQVQLSEADQK